MVLADSEMALVALSTIPFCKWALMSQFLLLILLCLVLLEYIVGKAILVGMVLFDANTMK
jgi:hypothetical protein